MRLQSPQPDRRASTAPQRSRTIPSPIPNWIRGSQHRAQHWHQRLSFGFHDGDGTPSNPSCLGIYDPFHQTAHAACDVDQGTNHRERSLGERNLSLDAPGLVTRTGMGSRLRPRNSNYACERKSCSKALPGTASANSMSDRRLQEVRGDRCR